MSERYNGSGRTAAVLLGFVIGTQVMNILHIALDDSDERVRNVQQYNPEISRQLQEGPGRTVIDLIVNDEEHSFAFHNEAEGSCTGTYEVHNTIATVVGPLACTQTVPNPVHS